MADDFSNIASPQVISRMLYLVNAERGDAGVPAVEGAEALHRAAQAHSDDMARRGYLDTRSPDGRSAGDLAARAGYGNTTAALVYSGPTSIAAVDAWMKGPGRDLLLSPHLTHLGIGLCESKWTLLLGGGAALSAAAGAAAQVAQEPPQAELDVHGSTLAMNLTAPTESLNAAITTLLPPPEERGRVAAAAEPPAAPAAAAPAAAEAPVTYTAVQTVNATPEVLQEAVALVNAERLRWHLPPLALSAELCAAAQAHAADMAQRNYFGHLSPEGEGVDGRAARAGYPGRCGESLAFGYASPRAAIDYWLADASSQASLLNGDYQHLGVGVAASRWVLVFGMPPAPAQPARPSAPPRSRLPFDLTLPSLPFGRGQALPEAPDLRLAARVLVLVNTERSRQGLFPLALSEALCQAAQAHSNDMAQRDYFAYAGPDGQGVESRVSQSGYAGRSGANLCMGHSSPEAAVKFFMQNEGNRQNVLRPEYRHLGVGLAQKRWTLVFGIPDAAPAGGTVGGQALSGPQLVARTLELVNQERARAGLPALVLSEALCRAAQAHAEDMARRSYVGSISPEGEDVGKRVDRAGYRWRSVTESTASDRPTPEAAVEAWMRAADHRANLLDPEFRHVGVGMAQGRWALVFARPQ